MNKPNKDALYSHNKARQSVQGFLREYEAIAISMSIVFEIEDFIQERGIGEREISEAMGITRNSLNKVWCGEKLIDINMLAGISQKYNVCFNIGIQDVNKDVGNG